jgi:hopene-associated glycosyltransferase HpnB
VIAAGIGLSSLAIWIGLLVGNGGFWLARERDGAVDPAPAAWPEVVAVVPARDEAEVIARSIASLAAQDYPGRFRIVLVDDSSSDGTAAIARGAGGERLTVLTGKPLAPGWTGKLAAVAHGIESAGTPRYLWLTDADIAHAPDTLRWLVARAESRKLTLVSLMARLRCSGVAEQAFVPAFVLFFQMLYPFARVNRPGRTAAAAGGCMLVDRAALAGAGGIAAIRSALIDDCAMGALMKGQGPIWLGLTHRSDSIRPYDDWRSIADMIARSAYAQLGYDPLILAGTIAAMVLLFAVPPVLTLFGQGLAQDAGVGAWAFMAIAFQPMLRFYRRSALWGLALPAIGVFYTWCIMLSAWRHKQGRGGMWKGRAQAAARS